MNPAPLAALRFVPLPALVPVVRSVLTRTPMLTDLSLTPFAETIRRLSAERKSGDLQVRSLKLVKTIFFDHGRIVFAASNLKKDRLGEALVADRKSTRLNSSHPSIS